MFRILVVGAGNIGARHIQSLCQLNDIKIDVLEPVKESLHNLKSIIGSKNYTKISFYEKISEIKTLPGIAIVATPAKPRKKIILKLLDIGIEKFLLEKLVCQSTKQYDSILKAFSEYDNAEGWVNFPRRYLPIYNFLKENFDKDSEPIKMLVDTGDLGIACGAIHQIDIFQYITNAKRLSIDESCVKLETIPSKREGYIDFSGNISILSNNEDRLLLNFTDDEFWPLLEVYRNSKSYYVIDNDHEFSHCALKDDGWVWKKTSTPTLPPLVSQITKEIVFDIMYKNKSKMPTLLESYNSHQLILDLLLKHYNENVDNNANILPVT